MNTIIGISQNWWIIYEYHNHVHIIMDISLEYHKRIISIPDSDWLIKIDQGGVVKWYLPNPAAAGAYQSELELKHGLTGLSIYLSFCLWFWKREHDDTFPWGIGGGNPVQELSPVSAFHPSPTFDPIDSWMGCNPTPAIFHQFFTNFATFDPRSVGSQLGVATPRRAGGQCDGRVREKAAPSELRGEVLESVGGENRL